MALDWLFERMAGFGARPALLGRGGPHTYAELLSRTAERPQGAPSARVVLLIGDWSPAFLAALLGRIRAGHVVVPVAPVYRGQLDDFARLCGADAQLEFSPDGRIEMRDRPAAAEHPLVADLRARGAAGLVILSSGTTGTPKAILHDVDRLTMKHREARAAMRTVALPPPDHMAGLDTLFYVLAAGGSLIIPEDRSPDAVCRSIAEHRAELLPATPSFLNLLLASAAAGRHDVSSLTLVTYGSEVMPESTLARARELLPGCRFLQKYGATEFGSPRTQSREDGSVWFRLNDAGCEHRIVDGTLWIRSPTSMLGYLNAPSPFSADGWFNTGDLVETDGEYVRVLGRGTDMINVGGQKVLPQEVENILLELDNVKDAHVYGERHAMMGQIVAARITLVRPEPLPDFKARLRAFCATRLPTHKVPVRIEIADGDLAGERLKKARPAKR